MRVNQPFFFGELQDYLQNLVINSRAQKIVPLRFACRCSDLTCVSCLQFETFFADAILATSDEVLESWYQGDRLIKIYCTPWKFITFQCRTLFFIQVTLCSQAHLFLQLSGCLWLTIKPIVTSESMFKIDFENSKDVNWSEHPINVLYEHLSVQMSIHVRTMILLIV